MAATPGMKRFYAILAGVAVLGLGTLGFLLSRPKVSSIPVNVTIQPSDTAGFRGYIRGSASAPVESARKRLRFMSWLRRRTVLRWNR